MQLEHKAVMHKYVSQLFEGAKHIADVNPFYLSDDNIIFT